MLVYQFRHFPLLDARGDRAGGGDPPRGRTENLRIKSPAPPVHHGRNKDYQDHEWLASFLHDRQARNLSHGGIEFYRSYLQKFIQRIRKPVIVVNTQDVAEFLASLTCSPGGKHAYYRAIRAFYMWALENDHIEASPLNKMKAPKVPKPLRHAVKLDDVIRLLAECATIRDKLIVSMLADTGLRRSELASIDVEGVDPERKTIKVWGKGAKERVVCFGLRTHTLFLQWLKVRSPGHRLFDLNEWGVGEMLKRLERRTGIKCNAHAFRRTFATESVRNGLNVFYVQSLLGHSSLTMTRIYAEQVSSEDAIKAYKPIVT